jgi:hypothetical protein
VSARAGLRDNGSVMVRVWDNGVGGADPRPRRVEVSMASLMPPAPNSVPVDVSGQ